MAEGASVSPRKHRAQGRGLIQVKGNTALSHGYANILPIFPHRYSSQSPTLHFLHITEVHGGVRLLGVGSEFEWMENTEVSERMNGANGAGCGLLPAGN